MNNKDVVISMDDFAQRINAKPDSQETKDALALINSLPLCHTQRETLIESVGRLLNNKNNQCLLKKGKMVSDIENSLTPKDKSDLSVKAQIAKGVSMLAEATERMGEDKIMMEMEHEVIGNVRVQLVIKNDAQGAVH